MHHLTSPDHHATHYTAHGTSISKAEARKKQKQIGVPLQSISACAAHINAARAACIHHREYASWN
jgi:hypothetical protein